VHGIEGISLLIEELDSGGYVTGFVEGLGGAGIGKANSDYRNRNHHCGESYG
jgi:hypothetical protein